MSSFRISNFTGDPFAIVTVSFGVISWIVSIAGAAAGNKIPSLTWWGLVYQILLVIMVFVLYLNNTIELYKFTLVGLLLISFLYSSNSVNTLIYRLSDSGSLCCAAGLILVLMLNLIWILYFGGHPESPTNQFIDSFSLKTASHAHGQLNQLREQPQAKLIEPEDHEYKRYVSPNFASAGSPQFQETNLRQSQLTTNNKSANTPYMSSLQLNGLENFSSSDVRDLTNNKKPGFSDENPDLTVPNVATFRYKAKALYSYDANPDDINEISFSKDEILDVDDVDGKWWQARRANGQVGICPSNYVKLIE